MGDVRQLYHCLQFILFNSNVDTDFETDCGVTREVAALLRHQEEEETDNTKHAQIEQLYEKH